MLILETITDALVTIGVANPIDEVSPQDSQFALKTLNRIIDSYNAQNLMVTYLEDISYPEPSAGWDASVTIGIGMDIDEVAPLDIQGLFWRHGGTDYTSQKMAQNEWSRLSIKGEVAIPSRHYVQNIEANNKKISFNATPYTGSVMHVMSKRPYTGTDINGVDYTPTDDIIWTQGFEKALMYRLAAELRPSYSMPVPQSIMSLAQEAEDVIKTRNYQADVLTCDSGLTYGRRDYNRATE